MSIPHLDADDLYAESVHEARLQPWWEKLFVGIDLFDLACEFTRTGIRMQHPDADESRVAQLLEERLAMARRLEDAA